MRSRRKVGPANFARMLLLGVVITFGCSLLFAVGPAVPASESAGPVHIEINAAAHIRTIPETLYGANLTAWDGQTGSNARFNNLIIASGRTEMRWPGGSWGDAFLWSDMEGPSGRNRWIASYPETLNLLSKLGGRLQPIVNFPGFWHEIDHSHEEAVAAAVAWAQDQMARTPSALYWEIGNEIMGPWEAGWEEGVISGTYYGNHFADFYRAMKEVNPMIRIGAVADPVDGPDWWNPGLWTRDMLTAAFQQGIVPDFLIIHAYPGSNRHSDYNPYLFSHNIEEIAIFTQDLNQIISEALGPEFSGTIPFWMTEYRAGGIEYSSDDQNRNEATEIYPRWQLFSGALFLSQYILEMATHGWEGSNSFGEFFFTRRGALPAWHPYLGDYEPVPDWYVYPFLTQRFGRNLVLTRDNHPLVRAYAALDAEGSLTIFAANNSPDQTLKANVEISGMVPTTTGQRWLLQGAGQTMTGATSPPQDLNDLSINGVVHPDPLSVGSTPGSPFSAGPSFQIELPPSSILFATVPAASGVAPDAVPPSPEGAEWKVKPHPIGDDSISMEAAEVSDPSGVEYSFICVEGGGHDSGWQEGPLYTDHGLKTGTLYRYVVATRDRSPNRNQSPQSDTASATPVPVGIPIEVENAGFEQPGTDPQDSWTTIPGWQSEGDQTDAVIDQIFPTEGTWNARLNGLSAPVWNLTNHLIQAGSVVQLTFSARDYWSGSTRFRASLFYDKDGVRQPIVSREFTLVRQARTYKVSFASSDQPQAIGHRLGIEFANLRQGSAAVDDVRLSSAGEFQVQFPHFASGLGLLSSEIYLQNPNPSLPVNTWLDFRADDGSPIEVELNGLSPAGESLVSLPAGGMSVLRSPASSPLLTGSVTSHSDQPLSGVLLFGGGTGLAGVAGKEDFSDRFRAPVEVRQSLQVNTGLALMNPTVLESRVDLKLAGTDGIPVAQAEVILPARGHRALFVTELQWVPAVSFEDFDGLLMINSNVPVAATVLRTSPGELATFPVVDRGDVGSPTLRQAPGNGTHQFQADESTAFTFAHFGALPDNLSSRILLFNLNDEVASSIKLEFLGDDGSPIRLRVNGSEIDGEFTDRLSPSALGLYAIESSDGSLATGSVAVTSEQPADGLLLFSGVVGVAGVGSSRTREQPFIGPVYQDSSNAVRTGIALVNLEEQSQELTLQLRSAGGKELGIAKIELPARGHRAVFIDEVPFSPAVSMDSLEATVIVIPSARAAALMLQTRPGQLATLPVK